LFFLAAALVKEKTSRHRQKGKNMKLEEVNKRTKDAVDFLVAALESGHSEVLTTLRKLSGSEAGEGEEDNNLQVLRESIEALTRAAELRERNATGHGEMVARYSELMGRALGWSPEEIDDIAYAARVHDVGKIFVPDRILNKGGPLSEEEFYLVKLHTEVGGKILGTMPGSEALRKAIEHHHEAFDGSGYPDGLRGEQIPLWARILCVADAYVNMTTDRSFASAKSSEQALAELERLSGIRYDGMLVRILARELKGERTSPSLGS
jgi:HD-GYP domain-containing protein (c-di-GMP phosphodiesterase class II)